MRVLVFGDSITQGYWDVDGGWVEQLRKHYDAIQITDPDNLDEPTIFNLGISADNSRDILDRVVSETKSRTRHSKLPIVVIQIGVNDSSIDKSIDGSGNSLSIEEYDENLRAIVKKVRPISSKLIFIGLSACDESLTTPVSWGKFHYTNKSLKQYEDKMKQVATELSVPFILMFDSFLAELEKGKDFLPDGLHPNHDGHTFMSNHVLKTFDDLILAD